MMVSGRALEEGVRNEHGGVDAGRRPADLGRHKWSRKVVMMESCTVNTCARI